MELQMEKFDWFLQVAKHTTRNGEREGSRFVPRLGGDSQHSISSQRRSDLTLEGLRMAGLHSIIGRGWCNPLFLKHFPKVLKQFESLPHERLAWFLFVAPKGVQLVRTREGGNNEALYNAGNLPEFIYKGVYKGATKDRTLVEFVVGRYTLPYLHC